MQRLLAMIWLTWKAAFRLRLFIVLAVLLLVAVVGLPVLIKDDGTARGFTQILLTYTLGAVTTLLGLSTLWLACGTLARDIEECQMQVIATKPIPRWQIWLGRWFGILTLNATLLALAGAGVYGLMQWRASRLSAQEQMVLRNEVLVARGSVRPPSHEQEIQQETEKLLQERLKKSPIDAADIPEVRRQILEQVKAGEQLVPPGYYHPFRVNLGLARHGIKGRPLYLRVKFNVADRSTSGVYPGAFEVGVPGKTKFWRSEIMSLAPETFHEFPIPADLFDDQGMLSVNFYNFSNTALLFPLEDGFETLFPEGSFGLNFARGLGIIFCWMALLAALGLAASSLLSFPVAAFVSLGALALVLCSGTMASAVSEGTIANYNAEKGTKGWTPADLVVIPVFRAVLNVIDLAKGFSPIDSLSTGRSISWEQLARAFAQIVLLLGGLLAIFGMVALTRRELATAQQSQ